MAISKAIKGAVVPVEEITSSFDAEKYPDIVNQLTSGGYISPREGGKTFEFLKEFDTSSFVPKSYAPAPVPGSSPSDAFSFIKTLTGAVPEPVTAETPEVKKFKEEKAAQLELEKTAKFARYDATMGEELKKIEQEGKQLIGQANNRLADLGILGTSTAAASFLSDIEGKVNELKTQTRTKYDILKLGLDATQEKSLLEAVDARIKTINDAIKERQDSLIKAGTLGVSLFQALSQKEQDTIKNQLEAEKNRITEDFNNKKISVDEYNAKIGAIEAQIKGTEAETNRFEAETARMKELRLGGAGRPSYDEFLQTLGTNLGASLDSNSPDLKALYAQTFPMTVKDARAKMDTEQRARGEVVQDMIDKGDITLEEAQQIHPDLSWFFTRKGLSSLEQLLSGYLGGTVIPPPEE